MLKPGQTASRGRWWTRKVDNGAVMYITSDKGRFVQLDCQSPGFESFRLSVVSLVSLSCVEEKRVAKERNQR